MHISTSFKYMCSAMAVLAYQGAAQLTTNTWKVEYQNDAAVDFTTSSTNNEITLTYLIGAGKAPTLNLYASADCSATTAATTGVATPAVVSQVVSGDLTLDTLSVRIDVDKTLVDGSNIWDTDTSKLEFCLELTLVDSVSSEVVTQDLQAIDITFDFDVQYQNDDDFAATADLVSALDKGANVDDYITAFKCTGTAGLLTADASALENDDILQVCIFSSLGNTVAIQKVESLLLTQANTGQTFEVMNADGTVANTALSTITDDNEETFVETIVPSRFFDTSDTIAVSGTVEVDFATGGAVTRRLVAFGNNRLGSNDRKMIEAPFEDADLPQETTDAKFNFDVPVEKAPTEDQFIDMNSGSTISAAAGALAAVAVSYLCYIRRTTTNDVEQGGVESVKGLDDSYTTRFTTESIDVLDSSERSKDD